MSGEKEFKTNYLLSRGDFVNQSINVVVVVIVVDIYKNLSSYKEVQISLIKEIEKDIQTMKKDLEELKKDS